MYCQYLGGLVGEQDTCFVTCFNHPGELNLGAHVMGE